MDDILDTRIQYSTIKDGIKAFAETYSFNIESELFNQLTKEQQVLWRKEIEQAVIAGGEDGVELARDMRYRENVDNFKGQYIQKDILISDLEKMIRNLGDSYCLNLHAKTTLLTRKEMLEDIIELIKNFDSNEINFKSLNNNL